MQSKKNFIIISLISLALGVLPEFISETMKDRLENTFGNHYDTVWLVVFISLGIISISLALRQAKSDGDQPENQSKLPTSKNPTNIRILQKHSGKGDNIAGDKIINS